MTSALPKLKISLQCIYFNGAIMEVELYNYLYMCVQIGAGGFVNAVIFKKAAAILIDCSAPVVLAGQIASLWKIPMVAFASTSPALSDKSLFDTVIRTWPPLSIFGKAILAILRQYNWTTVGLLNEQISDPQNAVLLYLQVRIFKSTLCFYIYT